MQDQQQNLSPVERAERRRRQRERLDRQNAMVVEAETALDPATEGELAEEHAAANELLRERLRTAGVLQPVALWVVGTPPVVILPAGPRSRGPRPRGAGRPARQAASRSSARSGVSGADDPEPEPARDGDHPKGWAL